MSNTIDLDVYKNTLKRSAGFAPVSGERGYSVIVCHFKQDDDWDNITVLNAGFYVSEKDIVRVSMTIDNTDQAKPVASVTIPTTLLEEREPVYFGLIGSYSNSSNSVRIATNVVRLDVAHGIVGGEPADEEVLNKWEELMTAINAGFALKEDKNNKVTSIENAESITDYPSVKGMKDYVSDRIANKADKATTLAGYGITDAYTKTQTNNLLDGKANASHTHSQYLTAQDITGKADKATTLAGYGITDAYTKTQTNNLLDGKSNASHTHSQYLTAHQDISGKLDKLAEGTANKIITSTAGGAVQRSIYSASSTASNITNGEIAILPTCSAIKEYVLEELERVGEYVDENALFDAIDTAFTGGGTLVPSIAIDNDNQSGDYILYYVDGNFVRHDIFNFSQYFITEPYNLYDPCAAYTVTDASQTGKVGYSVDSGTGSITVTRALGDGQKYIRYADKTLKAGTYTLSGKVTLHSNAADGSRTMCCNIGYEKTWQQVNLTTERGGSQNIGSSDKEGWFSCTVTLSYDQVFSFEAIPWSVSVCNSNLPAVLSNVQIIEGADIGAYSPAARTSVDIKARTLIGKRQVQSAAVNQNGTITFMLSDGTTLTTTGASVIGDKGDKGDKGDPGVDGSSITNVEISAGHLFVTICDAEGICEVHNLGRVVGTNGRDGTNGTNGSGYNGAAINSNGDLIVTEVTGAGTERTVNLGHVVGADGADGQDYVLTAQDKSDIADIVLSELPTTQGVLYGNTGN